MAQGDIVSERINQTAPSSIQPQPTHFGVLTAHGAPGTPTVLWDTALVETLAGTSDANLNLDVIEDASADTIDTFIGQTVLRIAPAGAEPGDVAGGTSREFVGTVVAAYMRTPLGDAPGSGNDYLLVKTGNLFFEDLASQFTVLNP